MKTTWLYAFFLAIAFGGFGGALGYLTHERAASRDCEAFHGVILGKHIYDCVRRDLVELQEELDEAEEPAPAAKPETTE